LKPDLTLKWSKKEQDLLCTGPSGSDRALVFHHLTSERPHVDIDKIGINPIPVDYCDSFVKELKDRGYDITTLKFTICKKP